MEWTAGVAWVAAARRPAVWLAWAAAAQASWWLDDAALGVGGGLLGAAAMGDPPRADFDPRGVAARAWIVRSGWPIAGSLLGGLAGWLAGRPVAAAVALAAWAAATSVAMFAARRQGLEGIAPVRVGLLSTVMAWAATTAAAGVAVGSPGRDAIAILVFAGVSATAIRLPAFSMPAEAPAVTAVAMASTLGGMVAFFFLLPDSSWAYTLLACGWFLCLTVPAVTVGPGGRSGDWLGLAAAGRPATPGTMQRAATIIAFHATVLGWPAMVAAILVPTRATGPAIVLGSLAAVAGGTVAAGWLVRPLPRAVRSESGRAGLLCLAALAMNTAPIRPPCLSHPAPIVYFHGVSSAGRGGSVLSGGPVPATLPQSSHSAAAAESSHLPDLSPGTLATLPIENSELVPCGMTAAPVLPGVLP